MGDALLVIYPDPKVADVQVGPFQIEDLGECLPRDGSKARDPQVFHIVKGALLTRDQACALRDWLCVRLGAS